MHNPVVSADRSPNLYLDVMDEEKGLLGGKAPVKKDY